MSRPIVAGSIPSGTGTTLLARLRTQSGQLLTRASVSGTSWRASNLTRGTYLGAGAFAATCVLDELRQNDPRWTADGPNDLGADGAHGYNFLASLPASLVALASLEPADPLAYPRGDTIQIDVTFTTVEGEPFVVSWRWQTRAAYGGG